MAAAEAAADRPWSNDSKGSSCVMRDERMERGAPMSAAAVEGTDADDAKSNEMLTPRRFGWVLLSEELFYDYIYTLPAALIPVDWQLYRFCSLNRNDLERRCSWDLKAAIAISTCS